MITCFDDHESVAGGQLVLAELARQLGPATPFAVVGPATAGVRGRLPPSTSFVDATSRTAPADVGAISTRADRHVLVANTYASVVAVRRTARRLRGGGAPVATAAILHSYPSSSLRRLIVRRLLARIDTVVVVEPGLTNLSDRVVTTPMLGLRADQVQALEGTIRRTGAIKAFGRSDRVKGLDLFPAVAAPLEKDGLRAHVALAPGIDGDAQYAAGLRVALGPWLEDGRRDPSWLVPGDLFLVTSRSETTCLAAQEAMAAGAFVVAPRVGAMATLETGSNSLVTYAPEDTGAAVAAVRRVIALPGDEYDARCHTGSSEMAARAGAWYTATVAVLTGALARLAPESDPAVRP